jgi:hypothetical protein
VISFDILKDLPEGTELKIFRTALTSNDAITINAEISVMNGSEHRERMLIAPSGDDDRFKDRLIRCFKPMTVELVRPAEDIFVWRGYWLCNLDTGRRQGEFRTPAYDSLSNFLNDVQKGDTFARTGVAYHFGDQGHRGQEILDDCEDAKTCYSGLEDDLKRLSEVGPDGGKRGAILKRRIENGLLHSDFAKHLDELYGPIVENGFLCRYTRDGKTYECWRPHSNVIAYRDPDTGEWIENENPFLHRYVKDAEALPEREVA